MTEPRNTGSFCSPDCRKAYADDLRLGISGPTTTEARRCIYCGKSTEPDDTGCAICGAKPARDVPFTEGVLMRVCAEHAGSDMLFARPTQDELSGMILLDERPGSFVAIKYEPIAEPPQ